MIFKSKNRDARLCEQLRNLKGCTTKLCTMPMGYCYDYSSNTIVRYGTNSVTFYDSRKYHSDQYTMLKGSNTVNLV